MICANDNSTVYEIYMRTVLSEGKHKIMSLTEAVQLFMLKRRVGDPMFQTGDLVEQISRKV